MVFMLSSTYLVIYSTEMDAVSVLHNDRQFVAVIRSMFGYAKRFLIIKAAAKVFIYSYKFYRTPLSTN